MQTTNWLIFGTQTNSIWQQRQNYSKTHLYKSFLILLTMVKIREIQRPVPTWPTYTSWLTLLIGDQCRGTSFDCQSVFLFRPQHGLKETDSFLELEIHFQSSGNKGKYQSLFLARKYIYMTFSVYFRDTDCGINQQSEMGAIKGFLLISQTITILWNSSILICNYNTV